MSRRKLFFAFLLISFLQTSLAHEELAAIDLSAYNRGEQVNGPIAAAGVAVIAISIACVLAGRKLGEQHKKIAFYSIAAVSVAATLYLLYAVAAIMLDSETKGPVHWHADFEIYACGEKLRLKEAEGYSTRVGPLLLHHHGDNRIHVEGVVRKLEDVRLSQFFAAIGGEFQKGELAIVLADGRRVRFDHGDVCPDGSRGSLKLFVNGKAEPKMGDYIISPYTDVPPGDVLKIIFDAS